MAYATSLAGSKLRAKLGASFNEQVAAPASDFAQRQLKSMGWTEGEGLGKSRQGRSTHITVKRREDHVGLGHGKQQAETIQKETSWWKDSMGDTLAKLSNKKTSKKSSNKKSKRKRHYTDEELFEATGGARFGMRAQRRATGKWSRTESNLSLQEEEKARASVEWNGRGAAKTMLSNEKATNATASDENSQTESKIDCRKVSKKLRKKNKSVDLVTKEKKRVDKDAKKKKKKRRKSEKNRE